jgi:hypothetical protein
LRFNSTFVGGSTLRALEDNNIFKTVGIWGIDAYFMGRWCTWLP